MKGRVCIYAKEKVSVWNHVVIWVVKKQAYFTGSSQKHQTTEVVPCFQSLGVLVQWNGRSFIFEKDLLFRMISIELFLPIFQEDLLGNSFLEVSAGGKDCHPSQDPERNMVHFIKGSMWSEVQRIHLNSERKIHINVKYLTLSRTNRFPWHT